MQMHHLPNYSTRFNPLSAKKVQSESDFMPKRLAFRLSPTCSFAVGQERVFMWCILYIRHLKG